ncbi:MAG: hypothetical protein GY913_19095 [Proteobacteria bacterium]|nr:hypothetical protein [Pseudomonadota bacterium]MCP4919016.1 hypothetical protein [Pseudomonadota bacterium]
MTTRIYEGKSRSIQTEYGDPLDLIWLEAARRWGWEIRRDPDVFAWWDGKGVLSISTQDDMDPDDCLGQMIFHEMCHALVAMPDKVDIEDWGLPLMEAGDYVEEHAANRVQAALADAHGLRTFFGTTTVFRLYYDALPEDPLQGPHDDPAVPMALEAMERARTAPHHEILQEALARTALLHRALAGLGAKGSLWLETRMPVA